MTIDVSPEMKRRVEDRLASGGYRSPDELLRDAFDALDEKQQFARSVAALRKSVADEKAGRTRPVQDAVEDLKREIRSSCGDE
jgi:Arc/MetJ-type ribon-helix-helix transcriptional regulator